MDWNAFVIVSAARGIFSARQELAVAQTACRAYKTPRAAETMIEADWNLDGSFFNFERTNTMSLCELENGTGLGVSQKRKFVKFELYGKEMVEKDVRASGNSGKIYLPPDWVGCKVKIVKID